MENQKEFTMEKVFQPQQVESRIYEMWETSGAFEPKKDPSKKPFTIVMPPPNITGQLHVGHALPENEKDYDRNTAMETLKLIRKLGFSIKREG